MEAFTSISILIIAALAIRNYQLSKMIKGPNKLLETLKELTKKYEEVSKANENLATEVRRQRVLNYSAVNSYNELRESILDMPPKSGRFFAIKLTNNAYLKHFSEN